MAPRGIPGQTASPAPPKNLMGFLFIYLLNKRAYGGPERLFDFPGSHSPLGGKQGFEHRLHAGVHAFPHCPVLSR